MGGQMSFEKHALGDSSFYLKTGSIYYINTNGALKGQLKELKLKTKKMKMEYIICSQLIMKKSLDNTYLISQDMLKKAF